MPNPTLRVSVRDVAAAGLGPSGISWAAEHPGAPRRPARAAGPGTSEITLDDAAVLTGRLRISIPGYWEIEQTFTYIRGDTRTRGSIRPAGGRNWHLSLLGAGVERAPAGDVITMTFVALRLRRVTRYESLPGRPFALNPPPPSSSILSFLRPSPRGPNDAWSHLAGDPCLASGSVARINDIGRDVQPRGEIAFLERVESTAPKIIAVYRPPGLGTETTIDFHVFFCPFLPAGAQPGMYPYGPGYDDLLARYLLTSHRMVHQHAAAARRIAFVFPLGVRGGEMRDLAAPATLYRMLQELNAWLQLDEPAAPRFLTVGRIALSGFSAGIRLVDHLLGAGPSVPAFWSSLKEIYDFDGVPGGARAVSELISRLRRWALAGTRSMGDRKLRIYTQSPAYNELASVIGATVRSGAVGATEASSASGTILFTPTEFWQQVSPGTFAGGFNAVHGYLQNLFMFHALNHSGFARA